MSKANQGIVAVGLVSGALGCATGMAVGLFGDDIINAYPQLDIALKPQPVVSSLETVLIYMASGALLAIMSLILTVLTWMVPKDGGGTLFRTLFLPFSPRGHDLVSARIAFIQWSLHGVLFTCLAPLVNFELSAEASRFLAFIAVGTLLALVVVSIWIWRRLDELMRTIWLECCGLASSLFLFIAISWSVLSGLGVWGNPTIFDVVAIFYGIFGLSCCMVYWFRRYELTVEEEQS